VRSNALRAALPPYATLLINQGMPIASLQKLLGHQDINKTMIYARVHDQTVKEQFSSAMDKVESILITDWPKRMVELESTTPLPASV
jgi:hypothetical protein